MVQEVWQDFISLLFPRTCVHCREVLVKNEAYLCTPCRLDLPRTDHFDQGDNPVFQKFAFLSKVKSAGAFLSLNKGGMAEAILYQLKYSGQKELGELMGTLMGAVIAKQDLGLDFLIPVPLHKSRLSKRGYNQSEQIAKGMAEQLTISLRPDLAIREKRTETQTRKNKLQRIENISSIYKLLDNQAFVDKRIGIVDDVVTTGATTAGLCELISEQTDVSEIHVFALAAGK